MDPGKRLKTARKTLGLTQAEFGEPLDFKWFKIKDLEAGKLNLKPEIAQNIENEYSINLRWLLTGEGEMFLHSSLLQENDFKNNISMEIETIKEKESLFDCMNMIEFCETITEESKSIELCSLDSLKCNEIIVNNEITEIEYYESGINVSFLEKYVTSEPLDENNIVFNQLTKMPPIIIKTSTSEAKGANFILKSTDLSMKNVGIVENSKVFIRLQSTIDNDTDIMAFLNTDFKIVIRTVLIQTNYYKLLSENENMILYPDITIKKNEWYLLGKVVRVVTDF